MAKFVGKDVAREAKLVASRGVLPIPPKDLIIVLYYLSHDKDPEVKSNAEKSLMDLPQPIQGTLLESRDTHPLIIDFYASKLDVDSELLEVIALNKVTHDETIELIAKHTNKRLIEIIANNQTRILRHPPIVDMLGNNPVCGQATIERILHFIALETGAKPKEEVEEKQPEEQPQQQEEYDDEIPDYMMDEDYPWMDEEEDMPDHWAVADMPDEFMSDFDRELSDAEHDNMGQSIMKMDISAKIKAAMMGNKEARNILIKDSNKIVAAAVLSSPKLTDSEIDDISKSKSVAEDIIRQIANSPEWTRSYNVKINLVNNPKTPVGTSMKFLNYLQKRDLQNIARSKNVPGPVTTAAKKLMKKRKAPQK